MRDSNARPSAGHFINPIEENTMNKYKSSLPTDPGSPRLSP
ncbi:Uncharacterized protein pbN1_34810 [Aromatoleum bremense]|nr:Uncharacterized protein pbN1_34810 [Aromatoleum bremense]